MREYFRQVSIRLTVETSFVVVFFGTLPSPSVTDRFFSMPCASVINRSAAAILHVQEISGAESRDPAGVIFCDAATRRSLRRIAVIAVIARNRRERKNQIPAILVRTPYGSVVRDGAWGSIHSAPEIS